MKFLKKRNGTVVTFDQQKISNAMEKAFKACGKEVSEKTLAEFTDKVIEHLDCHHKDIVDIEDVQNQVECVLMDAGIYDVAKAYITYRYTRTLARKQNTTDESILKLIRNENKELAEENANKSTAINSTQRDYIAGEVSRDLTRRVLLPEEIRQAHDDGVLHFHDMDYFIQNMFNCCLVDVGDMLDNGTVMNEKLIESPKSFQVAANVMTQIIACVASNQYGGQSVAVSCLGKYLRRSKEKLEKRLQDACPELSETERDKIVDLQVRSELKSGVQTIQYQLNTLMTTNGQSPFVTLFLRLDENDPYLAENAMIVEEILRQRLEGIKNDQGIFITPAFPKLVYVLDENNCLKGGAYDDITRLAIRCSAKRMYPDYISAKKMKENYEGNVFSPMGCVEGDEIITYKLFGILYVESFSRMWNRLRFHFAVKEQQKGNHDYLYMDTPEGVEIFDTKKGFVKNLRVIRNKADNWMRMKFSNGRILTCTSDHPFETENRGVVYAKDLLPTDMIRVNHEAYNEGNYPYDKDLAWMLGAMICDGVYGETISLSIAKEGEDEIQEKFSTVLKEKFGLDTKIVVHERGVKGNYKDIVVVSDNSGELTNLRLQMIGMFNGISKKTRQIPSRVFSWEHSARMAFLAGIIDADGYINNTMITHVQVGSTNKELALQEMMLAQSLGMPACVYANHYTAKNSEKIRYRVEFVPTEELVSMLQCQKKKENFSEYIRKNDSILTKDYCSVRETEYLDMEAFSYDVTTESEHFEVSGLYSHNCRSFLAPWKDENGKYKFNGRLTAKLSRR